MHRTPGEGRYAHLEREQRWLVRQRPDGLHGPVSIVDRYVTGTGIRLRRMDTGSDVGVTAIRTPARD